MPHALRARLSRVRETFWVLPAAAIVLGLVLGMLVPVVDRAVELRGALALAEDEDTARALLTAIATVGVSIAGVSFSVIVVALVLAAQQLSPRILRSFQRQLLNQVVLALLLGTATFALLALGHVGAPGEPPVPEAATLLAVALAATSLGTFVVFLHHVIRSLNPSAVIRRVAADGHEAVGLPYPDGVGDPPADAADARRAVADWADAPVVAEVRAPRAGYLASVNGTQLLHWAAEKDAFVVQRRSVGNFAVTGALLAVVHSRTGRDLDPDEICGAFVLEEERVVDGDVGFPIRQLADIALKGLSPSVNDPTTAENAMDSITDTLVLWARRDPVPPLRLHDGRARLQAIAPSLADLVRLGFDQVRRDAATRPSFGVRLLELLADLREAGGAGDDGEIARQAALIAEEAEAEAGVDADRRLIRETYERLHG